MGFAGGYTRMVAPTSMGGQGDWLRSLTPEALAQIRIQHLPFTGAGVQVPGMPATCDWDQYPQAMDQEQFTKIMAAQCRLAAFIEEADGLVTTCAYSYDGKESLDALAAWIGKDRDRPTFHLGPMLPPTSNMDTSSSSIGSHLEVMSLLDSVLASHGPQSLLYISFGTQHFPSDLTNLAILLQTLSHRQLPFIFAHPTHGSLPSTFVNSLPPLTPSAPYLLTGWAPQQAVLAHPACGWFLTHGGYNGTTEALMNGVPMIGWPFAVDQPMNVAHLARKMGVAWELPGAKTGYWSEKERPAASGKAALGCWKDTVNEVLDEMVGEEGKKRRASAEAVRDKLQVEWEDGGRAKGEFERFVHMYLD
jgi:UDP-glucoronosyl and UDP-glucosyl transferase